MKLPIKKKWFDEIRRGVKRYEFRDAHITFVCEETGEMLRREVIRADVKPSFLIPEKYQGVLEDENMIVFTLEEKGD